MTKAQPKTGTVYRVTWDNRPLRVIGFDGHEVFYDCKIEDGGDWLLAGSSQRRCHFYRTSPSVFFENATELEHIPLSPEEHRLFRPDLPLRTGRYPSISWADLNLPGYDDCRAILMQDSTPKDIIPCNKLLLVPAGPKGGFRKGVPVEADNGENFSALELVWKAQHIQNAVFSRNSEGIGLYRLGSEAGLPSYYIGEYMDMAGLLRD